MRMYDLIQRKKDGRRLTAEEIRFLIKAYTDGAIPDYQMSAMLMAICFQGLDDRETYDLTVAMRDSGDCLDLSKVRGITVDKHSTGGVGDKTTLVLAPVIAALGVPVAKMSGRGLGHTGGTIDKLECFPGFSIALSEEAFLENVNAIQLAIAGQTANLAPADKKIYALRDVTATVDQMSLIASSIMSKKLASGSDAIVLDVKVGSGAFMKNLKDAKKLAETMVRIGQMAGKKMAAVITNMDEPLGNAVGNSIEVIEAIEALSGRGPADLMEVVFALGVKMLVLAEAAADEMEAYERMQTCIASGAAKQKLAEWVKAQGGDPSYVWDTGKFPQAAYTMEAKAVKEGYIQAIDAQAIGTACMMLGGGREDKDSPIDLTVGIYLTKKKGDFAAKGDTVARIYASDDSKGKAAVERVQSAYTIGGQKEEPSAMIQAIIDTAANITNSFYI